MKSTKVVALCACVSALPIGACSSRPPKPDTLAIVHVTVVDTKGGPSLSDAAVVVDGGTISAVGRAADVALPPGARVVDGTGKFLIPGLWDMHVHISHEDVFFPLLIANGVTGVREMGNDMGKVRAWRKAIAEGRRLGPRMYAGGPIIDGPDIRIPKMRFNAATEAEGRAAVGRVHELGADFVKVWSLLPREAYFAIAAEAKAQGLSFAGHVPFAVTALEASTVGQKSIEHLANVLLGCSNREAELIAEMTKSIRPGTEGAPFRFLEQWFYKQAKDLVDSYDPAKAESLFRAFRENGTWMCPTLSLWRPYAFLDDPKMKDDPRLAYVPQDWKMTEMWFLKDQTAADLVQVKRAFAKDLEVVGAMHRAGVRFLAGTDTPNIHLFPGFALHDELALLVEAGFTPLEALQAATLHAAEFMGTTGTMGSVERGKVADLVLLDADPLADIANASRIRAAVANGRLIDRSGLDALLVEAAARARK